MYVPQGSMTATGGQAGAIYKDANGAGWEIIPDLVAGKAKAVSHDYEPPVAFELVLNQGDGSLKAIDDFAAAHKPKAKAASYWPFIIGGGLLALLVVSGKK